MDLVHNWNEMCEKSFESLQISINLSAIRIAPGWSTKFKRPGDAS